MNKKAKINYFISLLLCSLIIPTAYADLPLTIEDLLTAERRWRVELNTTYSNSDRINLDSRYGIIQVGQNQFLSLPISVTDARQNTDVLAISAGVRYGLTLNTELYSRITGIAEYTRSINTDGRSNVKDTRPSDLWFGINHRFSNDNETPALLGFAELALVEYVAWQDEDFVHGKSLLIGMTTYRAIDPIVLSLSAGYNYSHTRDVGDNEENPGDFLFINPSMGFAINNLVSMTIGGRWQARDRDEYNGKQWGIRTTKTSMDFGLGYSWSKKLTLQVNSRFDISGEPNASTSLNMIYKLSQKHL